MKASLKFCARYFSTAPGSRAATMASVRKDLELALESVGYIDASAEQAYLEHDPTARTPKIEYKRIYQMFARNQLDAALKKYDDFAETYGKTVVKDAAPEDFNLLVADTMHARDRIHKDLHTAHAIDCKTY